MKSSKLKINLLEGSILKKLLLLSAPLMATSFINMAYSMTDTAWLGRLGTDAVAATGAAHFFVWLSSSLAAIPRVGTSIYVAQEYGGHDSKKLNDTIKNGIMLVIIILGLYTLFISGITDKLMLLYNLETKVHNMAVIYLRIFSYGFIITGLNIIFSNIYYSLGNSFYPFIANVVGLIINIVLDPFMIFGWWIFPEMGVAGAAWASIISQFIVLLLFVINILLTKNEIYEALAYGKLKFSNIYEKFTKGLPAGMMSSIHAIISFQLIRYMSDYGTGPIAAYTVGSMLESITWMTAEGFQGGITAFVGQNYGARLYNRLKEIIKTSMIAIISIGLFGTFVLIVFRYNLFRLFIPNDASTLQYGAEYLFILGLSQLFMALELGATGIFNGLGMTKTPAFISIVFNALRIPIALVLMPYIAYKGIWLSMTISSIFKGLISVYKLKDNMKNLNF